jgi:hypothetical protein
MSGRESRPCRLVLGGRPPAELVDAAKLPARSAEFPLLQANAGEGGHAVKLVLGVPDPYRHARAPQPAAAGGQHP